MWQSGGVRAWQPSDSDAGTFVELQFRVSETRRFRRASRATPAQVDGYGPLQERQCL